LHIYADFCFNISIVDVTVSTVFRDKFNFYNYEVF